MHFHGPTASKPAPVFASTRLVADRPPSDAAARGWIPSGVDTQNSPTAAHDAYRTVLFVGKVAPREGPDLLVEAARLPFSAHRALEGFERYLRARAEALGKLVEFVRFVDRDRVAGVYAAATVMVVPGNWDVPRSLTLGEGRAAGLMSVARRRGALPEVGVGAALYFRAPQAAAFAACLRRLLTDDEPAARATTARVRGGDTSWNRQLARLTEWLGQWEPA